MPGFAHLFARDVVAVLELVKNQGVQTGRINLAVFRENRIFRGGVDNPSNNGIKAVRTANLGQFALHDYREFVNNGRINQLALSGMVAGTFKFICHFVAAGNAEKVSHIHMRAIGNADRECLCFQKILGRFMVFVNEQRDTVAVADHSPRGVHGIDFAIFIVGGNDQHRHGIHGLYNAKILFHD